MKEKVEVVQYLLWDYVGAAGRIHFFRCLPATSKKHKGRRISKAVRLLKQV